MEEEVFAIYCMFICYLFPVEKTPYIHIFKKEHYSSHKRLLPEIISFFLFLFVCFGNNVIIFAYLLRLFLREHKCKINPSNKTKKYSY